MSQRIRHKPVLAWNGKRVQSIEFSIMMESFYAGQELRTLFQDIKKSHMTQTQTQTLTQAQMQIQTQTHAQA